MFTLICFGKKSISSKWPVFLVFHTYQLRQNTSFLQKVTSVPGFLMLTRGPSCEHPTLDSRCRWRARISPRPAAARGAGTRAWWPCWCTGAPCPPRCSSGPDPGRPAWSDLCPDPTHTALSNPIRPAAQQLPHIKLTLVSHGESNYKWNEFKRGSHQGL